MSRWFRFYDDTLNDPKVQRLPGEKYKAWVNLLCLASKNDGVLPPLPDIAFCLRLSDDEASNLLNEFYRLGLFDEVEQANAAMTYEPHNWRKRQFKSDQTDPTAAHRQKAYRERNANRNEDRNADPSPSRPDTDTDTDTDTDQKQITTPAASDPREWCWGEGIEVLASSSGLPLKRARGVMGKFLRDACDDAAAVRQTLLDARANRIGDPVPWITAALAKRRKTADTTTEASIEDCVKFYAERRIWWRGMGPEPGLTGCRASPELLAKYGLSPDGRKLTGARG